MRRASLAEASGRWSIEPAMLNLREAVEQMINSLRDALPEKRDPSYQDEVGIRGYDARMLRATLEDLDRALKATA
jgi:hypothetical protein